MAEGVVCDPAILAGCKLGNVPLVQAQLAKNKDMINAGSATVAAGFEQPEVVKTLLESNANASLADPMGLTAVHVAAAKENLEVLQMLLADPKGKEAANMADEDGCTPLHHAAFSGLKANIEELMKAGAADVADNNGKTAAAEATEKGFEEVAAAIAAGPVAGDAPPAEGEGEGGGEEAEAED